MLEHTCIELKGRNYLVSLLNVLSNLLRLRRLPFRFLSRKRGRLGAGNSLGLYRLKRDQRLVLESKQLRLSELSNFEQRSI